MKKSSEFTDHEVMCLEAWDASNRLQMDDAFEVRVEDAVRHARVSLCKDHLVAATAAELEESALAVAMAADAAEFWLETRQELVTSAQIDRSLFALAANGQTMSLGVNHAVVAASAGGGAGGRAGDDLVRWYNVIGNRYEVIRQLGSGGMATVVLARDLTLDRLVAIKLLRGDDLEHRQRLFAEARIAARCQHDHVVSVYEANVHDGWPYIVFEHLNGRTLGAVMQSSACLPYTRAVEIMTPVLRALQHIHQMGIVHRDIKPGNIFITDSGKIKLIDFGIARALGETAPLRGERPGGVSSHGSATRSQPTQPGMLGTTPYMSPEQWSGSETDHLTDVWACGIMLYELICGRHPLHSSPQNVFPAIGILDIPMPSMAAAAPANVPRGLSDVVDRCLRKAKHQRWQSAGELLVALLPFATSPGSAPSHGVPSMVAEPSFVAAGEFEPVADMAAKEPLSPPQIAMSPRLVAEPVATNDRPSPVLHLATPASVTRLQRERKTLLAVAASPAGSNDGSSASGRTLRRIREELEHGIARDRFQVVDCVVPETIDVLRLLRRYRPAVVYFAGGPPQPGMRRVGQSLFSNGGLFLQHHGVPQLITPTGIQEIFGATGGSVKLVILDRAFTRPQAKALLTHVDCVVGTPATTMLEVAESYVVGLFGAIGDYESIATAHRQGCAAVSVVGLANDDQPQLMVRRGIDAAKLILAR